MQWQKILLHWYEPYMFGSRYLVAPVLFSGVTIRDVYLPEDKWKNIANDNIVNGGQTISVAAPMERIPVFERQADIF